MFFSCIALALRTFRPVNSQQRPDDFWSVLPFVVTMSEKCVSIMAAFSLLAARTDMEVVFRAFLIALSDGVPL